MSDTTDPAAQPPMKPQAKAPRVKFRRQREPGLDRWGLGPVERGWFRGSMQNVVPSSELTPYGELHTVDFDLYPDDETAPVLEVRMIGYTFTKPMRAGPVFEVPIGNSLPSKRIVVEWMRSPRDHKDELRAHRPVERAISRQGRDLLPTLLAIIGPIVVILGLVWVLWKYAKLFD